MIRSILGWAFVAFQLAVGITIVAGALLLAFFALEIAVQAVGAVRVVA